MNGNFDRENLRKLAIKRRDKITPSRRSEWNKAIFEHTTKLIGELKFSSIMIYFGMRSEVNIDRLIEHLLSLDLTLSAPSVELDRLVARRIISLDENLILHRYGMREPSPKNCQLFSSTQLELVLVPGVAFDLEGFRLGYGKGFYDRFLIDSPQAMRLGLAYEIQLIVDTMPKNWDIPVDLIITEDRTIKTKNLRRKYESCTFETWRKPLEQTE